MIESVRAEVRDWSTGDRRLGKRSEEAPDVDALEEGLTAPGEGTGPVLEMVELGVNQLFSGGKGWVSLIVFVTVLVGEVLLLLLLLDRSSCLRPPRFVATYSQMRPRFAQREHVGFSL